MMKAAFNLAAKDDPRIANAAAWWNGLTKLPEAEPPANKILTDDAVRRIVAAARQIDAEFGLLVEVLAVTGARPSQALRLEVADVRDQQLMMPSSKKGRRRHVLARALRLMAAGRVGSLFAINYDVASYRWWSGLGLGDGATLYSLRHSSIVRQLLANVPVRVVAAHHDTSVAMIEHTYSRHIGTVSDAVVRGSLIAVD